MLERKCDAGAFAPDFYYVFLHCEGAGLRDVHGALRLVREALGDCLGAVGPTIRMFCVAFARGFRGVPRRTEPGGGRRPPPSRRGGAARCRV